MIHLDSHAAMPDMGVGEDLREIVDRPAGNMDLLQRRDPVFAGVAACQVENDFHHRLAVGDACHIVAKTLVVDQGMSGLMSITGEGPGRPPVKVGAPITDITAGMLAALGICGAVIQRERTGEGQYVDTSLYEAGIVHTFWQTAIYHATGEVPQAMGSAHPLSAPYQAFKTKDSWVIVGAANQSTWLKFVDAIEAPQLADDPRFAQPVDRMENLDALVETLNGILAQRTTADWLAVLETAGVPAGPVYDVAEMAADPHTRARGMIAQVPAATGGEFAAIAHPVKYSAASTDIARGAPLIGEHNREVLAEYGFTPEEIEGLATDGALGADERSAAAD